MTVFVGGPMHGDDRQIVAEGIDLPAIYTHLPTGHQYHKREITLTLTPEDGQPTEYTALIYFWIGDPRMNDQRVATVAMQEALTRQWFQEHGEDRSKIHALAATTMAAYPDRPRAKKKWFTAQCVQCTLAMPFKDEEERNSWAEEHASLKGHNVVRNTEWK